ncbi:alpha/beta-hydrolase [Penicillium verhagenii]|nr:alpha/beta-hydrolase [Penicillium verhagenii]
MADVLRPSHFDLLLGRGGSFGGALWAGGACGLAQWRCAASNLPSGIIHLRYLCAYIQQPGRSTFLVNHVQLFLGDCNETQVAAALPHLVRSPLSAFEALSSGDPWCRLPDIHVTSTQGYLVPRVHQDIMLECVEEEGVKVRLVDVDTAHSVFLSWQEEMLTLVDEVARIA